MDGRQLFNDLLLENIENHSVAPGTFLHVPYVPSDEAVVAAMLELAGVGPKDMVYDLGSGETAEKYRSAAPSEGQLSPCCVEVFSRHRRFLSRTAA